MKAYALICDEKQQFCYSAVNLPEPAADQVLIRTLFTGVSIGTEFALIRNKISWGPYPLCTGYMGTGIIESMGSGVRGYKPGDKVYFRGNASLRLESGAQVSPVSGTHCSHVVTSAGGTHGIGLLPKNAPMDAASMFVLPAVGLYGVTMANPEPGQHVVVNGCGLIGLGVVAACAARGCVVTAVDLNPRSLSAAADFGADHLVNPSEQNIGEHVKNISPEGADIVFECTGIPRCIDPAIELCRMHGSFVWQGNYGSAPVSMKFLPPHGKRLKMFFPCDDGGPAYRHAVVKNMASGVLPWGRVISHRIAASESPDWFDRVNKGDSDITGLILQWSV